jgi:hypothetical protein
MDLNWVALLVAFAGGSLVATVVSAFVTHLVFHPVISVRLDEKKGSHGPVTIYYYDDDRRKVIGTSARRNELWPASLTSRRNFARRRRRSCRPPARSVAFRNFLS